MGYRENYEREMDLEGMEYKIMNEKGWKNENIEI